MGNGDEINQNEINTNSKVQEETVNLRPWDIALGRKTAPVFDSPEEKQPEVQNAEPKKETVSPQLREFTVSLFETLGRKRIDLNAPSTLDCILCYKDGQKDGEPALNERILWDENVKNVLENDKPANFEYLTNLYNMAKAGNLVFVEPGTSLNEANPITVNENGTFEILNQKSPLTAEDVRLSNPKYAAEHYAMSKALDIEDMKTVAKNYEMQSVHALNQAFTQGLSKQDFLHQIATTHTPLRENFEKEFAEYQKKSRYPKFNIKTFSGAEEKRRSELSEKAFNSYFGNLYDSFNIRSSVRELHESGAITLDELKDISDERDFLDVLLERGTTPEAVERNKERTLKYLGKHLDPNDPDFADKKLRAQAEVLNDRMKEIVNFDYEAYRNLSDEQFVDRFTEYHTAGKVLSLFRKEYDELKIKNPYLDETVSNRILEQEEKYGNDYMYNSGRIRAIANPAYGKLDINRLVEENDLATQSIEEFGFGKNELNLQRISRDLQTMSSTKKLLFAERVSGMVNVEHPGQRIENSPLYYDESGKKLDTFDLYDYAKQKKTFYAADPKSADSLQAFTYNPKTNGLTPKKLGKNAVVSGIKTQITGMIATKKRRDAQQEELRQTELLNQGKSLKYEDMLQNSSTLRVGLYDVIKEIHSKKLSVEKYADDYANRIYQGKQKKTYDEFCDLIGVPEQEKLSQNEINRRKAISAAAAKAVFRQEDRRLRGIDFKAPTTNIGMSFRVFTTVMCDPGAENLEKNKAVTEKMLNGTPAEKKALIENRFKELMRRGNAIVGKTFTDEELLDNMDEIVQVGFAAGMEMDGFQSGLRTLKKQGVDIDQEVLDQMAAFREKIYPYQNYYCQAIDYMTSPYYQYGGQKQFERSPDLSKMIKNPTDPDLGKTATSMHLLSSTGLLATADMLKETLEANGKKIESFYEPDGKPLGSDVFDISSKYFEGGELLVHYKGEPNPQKIILSDMEQFKPTVKFGEIVSIDSLQNAEKAQEQITDTIPTQPVQEEKAPAVQPSPTVQTEQKEQPSAPQEGADNIRLSSDAEADRKETLKHFLTEKIGNAMGAEFKKVRFDDAVAYYTSHGNGTGKNNRFEKDAKQDCVSQMLTAVDKGEKVFLCLPDSKNKTAEKFELAFKGEKPELHIPEREHRAMMSSLQQICNKVNETGVTRGDSKEFTQFKDKLNEVVEKGLPKNAEEYHRVMQELSTKAFAYSSAKLDQSMNAKRDTRFTAANQILEVYQASRTNQKISKDEVNLNIIASKMLKTKYAADIKKGNPAAAQKANEMLGDYEKFGKEVREISHNKTFLNMFKKMNSKELEKLAHKDAHDIVKFMTTQKKKTAEQTKLRNEPVQPAPDILNI